MKLERFFKDDAEALVAFSVEKDRNRVEANAHNAGSYPASNAIHGHINDFLVRTGLRSGVSELQLPCFTAVRAEIALMSGSAFAVTHHPGQ